MGTSWRPIRTRRAYAEAVLDPLARTDVTLEPLDDYVVVQPLEESETATGLIVPINEAAQCLTGIVAAVGPDVTLIEPGDKVLYPREGATRSGWCARATGCGCSSARS